MSKQIKIELPRGFMNVDITLDNHLIADTNYSYKLVIMKIIIKLLY
jgi:hypothetical protein